MIRESIRRRHPDLAEIVEELAPFTSDFLNKIVYVVDDEDLKAAGQYSEESLLDRYRAAKEHIAEASPPLQDVPSSTSESGRSDTDPLLDDGIHSNDWVIHGKHTATGMPLLANDPHLATTIPAVWQIHELTWGDNTLTGASFPGAAAIPIGRSKNLAWGHTTPLHDGTDIW